MVDTGSLEAFAMEDQENNPEVRDGGLLTPKTEKGKGKGK